MQPLSDHELTTELRALRPTPEAKFGTRLDARVAAGFGSGRRDSTWDRLLTRLRPTPRRLWTATTAGGLAGVAIATAVIALSGGGSERSSPLPEAASNDTRGGSAPATESTAAAPAVDSARYASGTRDREVERSAAIVLRTAPADVRRASTKVFEAVHAIDGIVLRSSIRDGGEGGGASFELLVPGGKLGDALASFSSIAEVSSRHESTADVTARAVGLGERLRDARATVQSLLAQLAAADTGAERAAAEARLRAERRHVAALRAQLSALQQRTNLARVSLRIVSDDSGAAASDDSEGWGVGSALADAGRILEIGVGVTMVGLAVLTPVALLALLAWLSYRGRRRAKRRRALD